MIIDKTEAYITETERQRLAELRQESNSLIASVHADRDTTDRPTARDTEKLRTMVFEIYAIRQTAEERYKKERTKKEVLADVTEIVQSITREDFLVRIDSFRAEIEKTNLRNEPVDDFLEALAIEDYANCFEFIKSALRVQLEALASSKTNIKKAEAIIARRAGEWYEKPRNVKKLKNTYTSTSREYPAYLPMVHGKGTDAIASMSSRSAKIDPVTKDGIIEKLGVTVVIEKLQEKRLTLGATTDKLLCTALTELTQKNDFRPYKGKVKEPDREVVIPLREYAQQLGYDIVEHEADTAEGAQRERQRAKNQLDNARKAIDSDLRTLQGITLTFHENIKGKKRDFTRLSLISKTEIKHGNINIAFAPEMAHYLAENGLITQYSTRLLAIKGTSPNAYRLGRKLSLHYFIDNNQLRGTADRISVKALLEFTELPDYEEVMRQDKKDRHWERRIKEPLEEALDALTQEGVLADWKYTHERGQDLTEEEAYNITSFESFINLYINFTLADTEAITADQQERLDKKQENRKKAIAKAKKRKQKTAESKEQKQE